MTKRDLFRTLIKIFGLYSIVLALFTVIPSSISSFMYGFDMNILLIVLGSLFISIGLFLILLFKTDSIINLLQLDKGFDEEQIQLGSLNDESILKLAIVIIGGFLIVENIAALSFDLMNAFKYKANHTTIEGTSLDYFAMTVGMINVVLGILFITNYKRLASFFNNDNS